MRKSLFFLSFIIGMLTLSGCSKDNAILDEGNSSQSSKIRWYGVKIADAQPSTRGVADEGNLWNQRVGIYIKFLNAPKGNVTIKQIQDIASEWEKYAGIKLHFVNGDAKANVRIAFDWQDNDWLTWSYTGTDAKLVKDQSQPTAVFGGLQYQDEIHFRGDVLRVFGQILGMEYEQRHQDWGSWKSEAKLQCYWEGMFEGMDMDWDVIKEYVFTPLTQDNAVAALQTPEIDELSVMAWPYYTKVQTNKLVANFELSEGDKAFIARLYPKDKQELPTIQEAWVDAGFFEWMNKDNAPWISNEEYMYVSVWNDETVGLVMTDLGAQQEYLPDVRDGEQLTTAAFMFSYNPKDNFDPYRVKLVAAPKFNTSNITNFNSMFFLCTYLTSIPDLDISKGTSFSDMFRNCNSLTTIPYLDTSNGTDFRGMFRYCFSLTSIPQLNTSKGTDFSGMFDHCSPMTTIPFLDTSKGTRFSDMFEHCTSLTLVPNLDTSNGIYFDGMFSTCTSLTSTPYLETSNGTDFTSMFSACTSLTSIPQLNTSKGTTFYYMFRYCFSLTTIPYLETSNGTDFRGMFEHCTSLTSIPQLNTSKGYPFNNMFDHCTSLTSIPDLDTSNGHSFNNMFEYCTSLTSIPNLDTSKGTDFRGMFIGCTSLQTKPKLDLSNVIENEYSGTKDMYKDTKFENDLL